MSAVVTTGGAVRVVGDGTTARSRGARRWRRARGPLAVLLVVVVLTALVVLLPAPRSLEPYSLDSAEPDGLHAVASILEDQGVRIRSEDSLGAAVRAAKAGSTLVVAPGDLWDADAVAAVAAVPADLVLLEPSSELLDAATDGRVSTTYGWGGSALRDAGCDDPDATAAGRVPFSGAGLNSASPDVTLCFSASGEGASYAVDATDGRTVRVAADALFMTNGELGENGSAALALRMLGHTEDVVWYVPEPFLTYGGGVNDDPGPGILPPAFWPAMLLGLLVVLVLALWRGRRLGRVVTEDLPVVVRPTETTLGRARLYRRAGARGHAAAGLRARSATRLAARLGLPRSAGAAPVVDAVSRASGRPGTEIEDLLYGPPPADDAALLALARRLDLLESEVHPL
ncbi:hypothetical protein CLV28_2491 [Sediminihabitans luteus]|uniref:DUF4350 domain-containing protein n=1 Tax=Sediminihabitans luteus TaxID=1138585 RepID=A0A2M9CDK2_9CELL|nr:DUF4350 domain-containing protein [Sediminihabitans luteus]PJJ70014.1 hypothetical protein CLV28_2491 [Sediminihabitans luteus]GII99335.1 hypothetical protein Slu03_17130 [Sediminihabitans luteus]